MAYTWTDLLQFAGPVQTALREAFGWGARDYWFPEIRSVGGAATMFVFVLYPYVYLLARTAFIEQSVCALDAGRILGNGPWRNFARVALPLARPAIAAGTALALMETLADFGTVAYFEVQTFTTGIVPRLVHLHPTRWPRRSSQACCWSSPSPCWSSSAARAPTGASTTPRRATVPCPRIA